MSDLFELLQEQMQREFDVDPARLSLDTTLESIGLDSLHAVALLLDLETQLNVDLSDISLTRNSRLGELIKEIETRMRNSVGAAIG